MDSRDWQEGGPVEGGEAGEAGAPPLSVIIPCYNEAANVAPLYQKLLSALGPQSYEILFVDDGSVDATCAEVDRLRRLDPGVRLLRLVRNAGQQQALRAGYRAARGRWVLTMDADLQHPAEAIPAMLARAAEGYDVVQMVREGRQVGFGKDLLSRAFYKVFNSLSDVPMVENASDFRLVSRRVCDVLNALPERGLVVRAILPVLGFRTASLPYPVGARLHGTPAYGLRKSLSLGSQALFGFSAFPLKLAMRVGAVISALAFAYGLYNVGAKIFTDRNVPGYTDIIASILFLSGFLFLYLGILGRYLLVVVDHLKSRPEYLLLEEDGPPAGAALRPRAGRASRREAASAAAPTPGVRPQGRRA